MHMNRAVQGISTCLLLQPTSLSIQQPNVHVYHNVKCIGQRSELPAKGDTVVLADASDLLNFMNKWYAQDQTDPENPKT